jgi:3'(2'), 5'-bisphosphate nucleotidase
MSTTTPYALETRIAISAVRRACLLTSSVFNRLVKNETLTKGDKSPVTVADYSAQALISSILQHNFPSDPIVGEEDAKDLREPGSEMTRRVVELADEAVGSALVEGEKAEWGIGPGVKKRKEEWLDAIDRGNYEGGRSGSTSSSYNTIPQ